MVQNLEVEVCYLYPVENAEIHKTEKYEIVHDEVNPTGVFRRGLAFTMAVRFLNRAYEKDQDVVKVVFNFGQNPNIIKGTKAVVKVDHDRIQVVDKKRWYAGMLSEPTDTITLDVYAPSNCPVGQWGMEIETSQVNSTEPSTIFKYTTPVYILFNPWNCDDLVYMPEERLLDEYVLTDVGKIWVGPYGSSRGREWVFGQFDECVLPAATLLFSRSELIDANRGDPIRVTRTISKLVNSNDDNGILVGRWDGSYEDGIAPAAWTGSADILRQFLETGEPVSYGQCWVFSGVVATICRALGIPSRVVSNLVSAHDANATLTVDKYFNSLNEEMDFDPMNPRGEDSIWNYHVWNDVWMARPDLPRGYGGWQAIDATPQETSDGVFQCGPASLEAIKKGSVGLNYDVAFLIASVNADLMRWKEDPSSELGYSRIFCNKYHIGRMILTKQPFFFDPNGDKDRQDVTCDYKPKEGTDAERISLYNAVRGTQLAKTFYAIPDPNLEDIEFDLIELERIKLGEDFSVTVHIKNKGNEIRNIDAVLSAGSIFYTGVKSQLVKKAEGNFRVKPKSIEKLTLLVKAEDYMDKLVEYCIMKLYAVATVKETRQTWADEDDFQVIKPNIEIIIPALIPIKKSTRATLKFVNPLKKKLTDCKFRVSGPNLLKHLIIPYRDVDPEGLVRVQAEIVPKAAGEQTLVATFSSKELVDIRGSSKIEVFDDND